MTDETKWVAALVVLVGLGLLAVIAFAQRKPAVHGRPTIVCVDSTFSTEDVRDSYQRDLEAVVRMAAGGTAHLYMAACGANATGEVDWAVDRQFPGNPYGDSYRHLYLNEETKLLRGSIEDVIATDSEQTGTPLGEMLAVQARQCQQGGGRCTIYLFTDGEWADGVLHLPREAISAQQAREYREIYEGQLRGLQGAVVNFVGVGLGTRIGEQRLSEARRVAETLVAAGGGEMGSWTVRL